MENKYLLWHIRHMGWLNTAGVSTTAVSDARRYSEEEAAVLCKRTYDKMTGFTYLPVEERAVVALMNP